MSDAPAAADGLPARLGVNAGMNYAAQIVTALSALIVTPIILDHLGATAFGVWALAGSVVLYLELFELGFGVATVKLVAEDAVNRPERVVRTLNTNFFVLSVFGSIALVLGLVIAVLAPDLFSVPDGLRDDTVVVFAVLAVSMAASVPLDVLGSGLAGYQRYDLLSGSNIVSLTLVGVVSVAVLFAGGGIVALAVGNAAVLLGMHAVRWVMLSRLVPGLRFAPRLLDRGRVRMTARLSGWFMLWQLARVVIYRVDVVVVGLMLGVDKAAVYAIGAKLAVLGRRAVQPLSKLFFPYASTLSDNPDPSRFAALMADGTRVALVVGLPVSLVLGILAWPAIDAWVGTGYDDAAAVVAVLAAASALFTVTETAWYILSGTGRARLAATVTSIEAVVNLGASLALARPLGPAGVALGTLIGVAAVDLPVALVAAGRAAAVPVRTLLRRALLPHAVPAAVTAAALLAIRGVIDASPVPVVLAAGLAGLLYLAVYVVTGSTPAERERLRGVVRHLAGLGQRAGRSPRT